MLNLKRYKKEINDLKKKKGVEAAPLEILDKYVNEEISYNEAVKILDNEEVPFRDLQKIIIVSSHPAVVKEELDKIHGDYLRGIFRELRDEDKKRKSWV